MNTTIEITTRHFDIPSDTPGIQLHVRNKRAAGETRFGEADTVLLMHGATYSAGSLYDTPVEGESFMDYLARRGFDVYAVDVRGYGESSRPLEMSLPAEQNLPAGGTHTGIRDFGAALRFVLHSTSLPHINVIGMSWGGTVTGAYTAEHPHHVRRLGLIAPQWVSREPIPLDVGGTLGAYRVVHADAALQRWVDAAPATRQAALIPPGTFDAWLENAVRTEPDAQLRANRSFRAPNGPLHDIRQFWAAGKPFYEPSRIEVPVLLLHGEWDVDIPLPLAAAFFAELKAAPTRRWLEIGEATHMLVLERHRRIAFDALAAFLREAP